MSTLTRSATALIACKLPPHLTVNVSLYICLNYSDSDYIKTHHSGSDAVGCGFSRWRYPMSRASPTMMKLPELKRRTRQVWEALNTWKDGVVLQPENFDKEVKSR